MEAWRDLVSCFQPNSAFTFPAPLLAPSQLLQAASLLSHFLSKFMLMKWKFTFVFFLNLAKIAPGTFMANSSWLLLHSFYISQSSPFYTFTHIQLSGVEFHSNLHFTHFTQTRSSPLQLHGVRVSVNPHICSTSTSHLNAGQTTRPKIILLCQFQTRKTCGAS